MRTLIVVCVALVSTLVIAQNKIEHLPFHEIPEAPKTFTAGTVAARMVDGLGFRYYWATEGLRTEDLAYKPSESGRTSRETIHHIYQLSTFIRNSVLADNKENIKSELSFKEKRKQTLLNFKVVSDALRNTKSPLQLDTMEVPFWNIINGPMADALWHCGQLVMLRRASGNPFNSKVNVFQGKLRE